MFLETSALSGENVEEAFLKCTRTILAKIESGKVKAVFRLPPFLLFAIKVQLCAVGFFCVVLIRLVYLVHLHVVSVIFAFKLLIQIFSCKVMITIKVVCLI